MFPNKGYTAFLDVVMGTKQINARDRAIMFIT